jgi:hypothetical protein
MEVKRYIAENTKNTKAKTKNRFVIAFGPILAVNEGVISITDYISYRDNLEAGCDDLPDIPYRKCHVVWTSANRRFKAKNRILVDIGAYEAVSKGIIKLSQLDEVSENLDAYLDDIDTSFSCSRSSTEDSVSTCSEHPVVGCHVGDVCEVVKDKTEIIII